MRGQKERNDIKVLTSYADHQLLAPYLPAMLDSASLPRRYAIYSSFSLQC